MRHPPANTNAARWHSIKVTPRSDQPKIHFYNKLNPVWWAKNSDEPVPPDWYQPEDRGRVMKWHFRNPFHNFGNYVIGVADKEFVRSWQIPERNSNPRGGLGLCGGPAQTGFASVHFLPARRVQLLFRLARTREFRNQLNYSRPPQKPHTEDSQSKPAP